MIKHQLIKEYSYLLNRDKKREFSVIAKGIIRQFTGQKASPLQV
jgi:hypothetical protein